MKPGPEQVNALTVDLEEYYQVEGFSSVVRPADWPRWESRIERSTHLLLEAFSRHGVYATFFTLGWIADRHPALIRAIAATGHEVACHGYEHQMIYRQTPDVFRFDVRRAKHTLEDLIGGRVEGYRAPSYSITPASLWALDILIDEGFRYDSSIFPIHHDRYGIPGARRFPHRIRRSHGEIVEFPPSTVALGGINLPLAGGGYFRLLPYSLFRRGLRHINQREQQAAIFVVHPWEIDPDQPLIDAGSLDVWRHRLNLHRTMPRLEALLADFRFAPVRQVLQLDPADGSELRTFPAEPRQLTRAASRGPADR